MKYSENEKIQVVKAYCKLGSVQKAIRKLGYPKRRNMVYRWIEEYSSFIYKFPHHFCNNSITNIINLLTRIVP